MRLFALLALVPAVLHAQVAQVPQAPSVRLVTMPDSFVRIAASGQSTVRITPNRATIFIVIDAAAPTFTDALARGTSAWNAVRDTLLRAGIPGADVTVIPYGVAPTPNAQYGAQSNPAIAYTSHTVIRLTTPVNRLPELTVAALSRGASNISAPQFSSTEIEQAHHDAIAQAMAMAQAQAEQIATAMGKKLGRITDLNASPMPPQSDNMTPQYLPSNTNYDSQARLVPEIRVTASVMGRWAAVAK